MILILCFFVCFDRLNKTQFAIIIGKRITTFLEDQSQQYPSKQTTTNATPLIILIDSQASCLNSLFNIIKSSTDQSMKKVQKYTYITHPNHLPLELTGNSKKRSVQLKRQQFNGEKGSIDGDSRTMLAKKINNNINDLSNLKSVLPSQCDRKRSRPNSIKTFKQGNQIIKSSGVQYLMHKTENLKPTHHERAHISQYVPPDLKRPQKKHFQKENIEPISVMKEQTKAHKETVEVRLANDIYSNPYRMEKEPGPAKKMEPANFFKKGYDLGLQDKKGRKVSDNKLIEMIGSEGMNRNQGGLKERRQDWRISNVTFY